jgi:hypothetical protein
MSISSINNPVNPASSTPAATTASASSATNLSAGLTQTAVTLASEASIVSLLGGSQSSATTYTAQGLLSAFTQAGTAPANSTTSGTAAGSSTGSSTGATGNATNTTNSANSANSASSTQATQDQAVLSSIAPSSTTNPNAGLYNAVANAGGSASGNVNGDWATVLKSNPSAAGVVSLDAMNQAIVGTISTTA